MNINKYIKHQGLLLLSFCCAFSSFGACLSMPNAFAYPTEANVEKSASETVSIDTTDETAFPPFIIIEKGANDIIDEKAYTLNRIDQLLINGVDIHNIKTLSFTNDRIEDINSFDKIWSANIIGSSDLMCYLKGTDLIISGKKIFMNPCAQLYFAANDGLGNNWWSNLEEINGLENINTSNVTDMSFMFNGNTHIKNLDLNTWDVSRVKNMSFMFNKCLNLETITIKDWDVSNVENFSAMFQGNSHIGDMKLKHIDVDSWDMSNATDVGHMFYGCGQLESLNVTNWDVSNVKSFDHTFSDCFKLKDFDVSNWDVQSVICFDAIFNDCRSLEVIDISNWDTSKCTQFSQMFEACVKLKEIKGIENINVSNASNYAFSEMFHCCSSLKHLDLSKWNTSKADNFGRMFAKCYALDYLDISNFNFDNMIFMEDMTDGVNPVSIKK